jgi:hypothetical protein
VLKLATLLHLSQSSEASGDSMFVLVIALLCVCLRAHWQHQNAKFSRRNTISSGLDLQPRRPRGQRVLTLGANFGANRVRLLDFLTESRAVNACDTASVTKVLIAAHTQYVNKRGGERASFNYYSLFLSPPGAALCVCS